MTDTLGRVPSSKPPGLVLQQKEKKIQMDNKKREKEKEEINAR